VIPVRMNHIGMEQLRQTRRHRLKVRLQGRGVNPRWVVLKGAQRGGVG
jgi:hypothetical protein